MKMHNKLHVLGMLLILMVPILLMVAVANAQPANDVCANATGISNLPFTDITINTSAATVSPSDDPSNFYDPFNTVWYKGTPNANLEFEANTFGSGYDTTLTVVTGSPGSFTLIACNDDSGISGSEVQSQVTFNATAGVTYYFMVGSKATGGGNLVFNAISTSLGEVILVPTANAALQGVVLFKAKASDFSSIYPVSGMSFSVREPGGDYGTPIGGGIYENLAATKNQLSGYWEYSFDTTDVPDADYVIFAIATDNHGNQGWSTAVPFSISNGAPPTTTTTAIQPTTTTTVQPTNAKVAMKPETINLKRRGQFIAAIIKLPQEYKAGDVDIESIKLCIENNAAEQDNMDLACGNFKPQRTISFLKDSLIVKFSNREVLDLITNNVDIDSLPATVTFLVQWNLKNGESQFEVTDTVRVINSRWGQRNVAPIKGRENAGSY